MPAGAVLLADYLRVHLPEKDSHSLPKVLIALHALIAAAPVLPAILIAYAVRQHRLPGGRPLFIALAVTLTLCAAIAFTLFQSRFRMLRFITLIPVVLAVAAVLKLGSTAIDETLSARPLAVEMAGFETRTLPVAVFGVKREVEYGLAFYRNQPIIRYESGDIPKSEHLLVVPATWKNNVTERTAGRHVSFLVNYGPQGLDLYWVSAAGESQ